MTKPIAIPEPTADQCSHREPIPLAGGQTGWAAWYPQMGGYVGKCVVVPRGGCFDVYVWHDGEFPFGGLGESRRSPARLHHCLAEQFVEFGQFVAGIQQQLEGTADA